MGRENKSYQDLQEIYKAFEDQLAGIASASTPSAGSSATATAPMVALDQSYDALYQAQQKIVLAVGSRYMYSNEMYQLQQMDAQKLVLEKVVLFDSQAAALQVETASCHKHLKPTKNSTPQLLDGTTADAHLPPKSCQEAVKPSKVFLGLLEASQQLQPKSLFKAVGLEVVGRRAYSLQKIGAGQLTLLPIRQAKSISRSQAASMGRLSSKGRLCTSALPNLSRWRQRKLLAVAAVRRFGGSLALRSPTWFGRRSSMAD